MKDFQDLTYRGQARRLRALAFDALRQHGLTQARLSLIGHWENTTFRVDSPELPGDGPYKPGRCLLRIHRPGYQPRGNILSELMWLDALVADGFIVPQAIPTPEGDQIVEASAPGVPEARFCTLMRWVEGRFEHKKPQPRHYERLGALMARLHNHAATWQPPEGFTRGRWDWATLFENEGWHHLPEADRGPLEAAARQTTAAMADLGEGPEAFGLVHADLHFGNVLFAGGGAQAIDFDDCAFGHWIYDVATTLSGDCESPQWAAIRGGLIRGYRRHRTLEDAQLEHLDAFMIGRRISLVLWGAERALENPAFVARVPKWIKWTRALIDARMSQS